MIGVEGQSWQAARVPSDYTFAVRGKEASGKLVTIGKAYGLQPDFDAEIA